MLTINEIFYSIQGESTFAGRPCVFVRLTGCDLRCAWCDTAYAFDEGRAMTLGDIMAEVAMHQCSLVEITGGEPLLQRDVHELIQRLLAVGQTVLVETGGQIDVSTLDPAAIKIMDIKCPASGEAERTDWENISRLAPRDQVKFVITDRTDYEYARTVMARHRLAERCKTVLMSPTHGVLEPSTLASWILEDQLPVRLQLQMHKYIWGADRRGV